jgi:RNA-directed DNA polymerase
VPGGRAARGVSQVKANGGAPGIDQQTFEMIEKGIGVGTFLRRNPEQLVAKRYKPLPVRRVYIPKADGTQTPAWASLSLLIV